LASLILAAKSSIAIVFSARFILCIKKALLSSAY
jgi:hypothetical protein